LLLAGKLHAVRVPGAEEEAVRDVARARETVGVDLMRARHRLSKLLLRHGIRFDDGAAWTERHRQWLAAVTLPWPAAQATLLDARGAIDALVHRRDSLECEIIAMLPSSPWRIQAGRLRCLRGIDTLSAVGLCAEIGDFERFAKASDSGATWDWSQREHHRSATPAGLDHQNRGRSRPPTAGRGCLALSARAAPGAHAHRPPARPATAGDRGRLERAATPSPHLETTGNPRQTPHDRRRRRRPRARRVLLGDHPNRVTHTIHEPIPTAGPVAGRHARGTRDPAVNLMKEGLPRWHAPPVTGNDTDEALVDMLHAGLDLSRRRLDVCLLSPEGERLQEIAVPPDADGLAGYVRRVRECFGPVLVRAAIESMNGARFVHDTLERCGWEVEIADAQKVKGLAPLACKTDKIDSWVGELSRRDLVPAIWLPSFELRAERERALAAVSGPQALLAEAPRARPAAGVRAPMPGLGPVRGTRPRAS
jgi:transposase